MVSLKREVLNGKIALEFELYDATCLTGRNSSLVTKIKDMAGNNLLSMYCYIHRQNLATKKMAPELNEVLSQSVKIINYVKKTVL